MYRESLLGVAFAATLSELSETNHLTEPQRANLWAVFDRVMDGCLAETPPLTRVVVRTPVEEYHSVNNQKWLQGNTNMPKPKEQTRLITEEIEEGSDDNVTDVSAERGKQNLCEKPDDNNGDNSSSDKTNNDTTKGINTSSCTANNKGVANMHTTVTDATLPFPVYRCVDGLWTILLKNPEVSVRDEFGVEEKLQLDYLKVYLKDVSRKNELTSKQKRKASATKRKRRP